MTLTWLVIITVGVIIFGRVIGVCAALITGRPPPSESGGVAIVMLFWVILYVASGIGSAWITWRLMK